MISSGALHWVFDPAPPSGARQGGLATPHVIEPELTSSSVRFCRMPGISASTMSWSGYISHFTGWMESSGTGSWIAWAGTIWSRTSKVRPARMASRSVPSLNGHYMLSKTFPS